MGEAETAGLVPAASFLKSFVSKDDESDSLYPYAVHTKDLVITANTDNSLSTAYFLTWIKAFTITSYHTH
jgi:hypothetical protein